MEEEEEDLVVDITKGTILYSLRVVLYKRTICWSFQIVLSKDKNTTFSFPAISVSICQFYKNQWIREINDSLYVFIRARFSVKQ